MENDIIDAKSLKTLIQKLNVEDGSCYKNYKTEEPKNFEIFAPISLEVRLLCRDTGRISLDYKWLPLKLIIKITELKMQPYEL